MAHKLKAQIVGNHITPEANDFVGIIESFGSVNTVDIVDELVNDGMEIKKETATDIVTRFLNKCSDKVLSGYSVNTSLFHMHATIKGAFYNKKWDKDVNKLHISISQGSELSKAVAETTVDIIGEKADPIAIFGIADLKTGATDGTVTPGFNVEIKGTYIKLVGDDPACGVSLRNLDTQDSIKLEASSIVLNEPSRLLLLIPADLAKGTYELRVTTQFTGAARNLKQPRTVVVLGNVVVA
jgi:hypothetical protein